MSEPYWWTSAKDDSGKWQPVLDPAGPSLNIWFDSQQECDEWIAEVLRVATFDVDGRTA